MPQSETPPAPSNIRRFFLRGLALVLPTLLTILLLTWAYAFIQNNIAAPINEGIRWGVIHLTPYPRATPVLVADYKDTSEFTEAKNREFSNAELQVLARGWSLEQSWARHQFALDMIGLVVALAVVLLAGALVGSFVGKRMQAHGETLFQRLPVIKQIYPSVKQLTDMLMGQGAGGMKFHSVVAVEFPRRESWVIGLVTGPTIKPISERTGRPCVNVFIPNTPTPISGFVVMVPAEETIPLAISIEEALRFIVSAGLLLPEGLEPGKAVPVAVPQGMATIHGNSGIPGIPGVPVVLDGARVSPPPALGRGEPLAPRR